MVANDPRLSGDPQRLAFTGNQENDRDDAALIEVVGRLRRRRIPQPPIALVPKREDGAV
jgi:hypothetical protein